MRLISLSANKQSFRTVKFNKTGLSFIIAKQKNPGESDRGKTYNGVGKSLLVAIIHFCLGASKKSYKSFCDKLAGWIFVLNFEIGQESYSASRATDNPDKILLNNNEISLTKFNEKLEKLCFDIPSNVGHLSFRSLLPFFIRPRRESYVSYDKPSKTGSDYQKQIYNAFLIGLDVYLAQQKHVKRKEQDRIKKLADNIKHDELLREFFSGDKDVTLTLRDLDDKIEKFEKDLHNFQVAEDYYDVKTEADHIERELSETQNQITLIENQIKNIEESLQISPDLGKKNIENIYNEAKIFFSDKISKTLNQLEIFYEQLIQNRTARLTQQKMQFKRSYNLKVQERKNLEKELDNRLQYLGAHQALDVFVKINDKLATLKNKRDSLQKYDQLLEEYHRNNLKIKKELLEAAKQTDEYLKETKGTVNTLRDFFRYLAKRFYPNAASGITVYNNDGENQIRFDIEAKIEADASDGINNVKIFCYDLTILFKGLGHSIHFLFHDSRLFDGIDERQKAELFKILNEMFSEKNNQYIATINQNQLNEVEKYLTKEDFSSIIKNNIVLTLTDDSASEKLLGIKVDLKYE